MRKLLVASIVSVLAMGAFAGVATTAGAGGVTGPSFYVDGTLYRTVGTPTDLSNTGAPESSFETIYQFFGVQPYNVAVAAPGDPGYKGGRWAVHGLQFADYPAALAAYDANGSGDFDSAAEVQAAIAGGAAIDLGVVKRFECPLIQIPRS